ncbi:MAG TPA: chromate resistance protein ChrB domain-containing protein [Stellaceae bacterium]|nr:chromate resistance protein ChrB domain-containing protein [Stellaceae bacterium]
MDASLEPDQLVELLRGFPPPLLIDLRSSPDETLAGAVLRSAAEVAVWTADLEIGRLVVVFDRNGGEDARSVAGALRDRGLDAGHLAGGFAAAAALGLPLAARPASPSRWVTRERPKIDRIACPWLIRRFIDPDAEFLYVRAGEVFAVAAKTGATAYDIPGAPFAHDGERCSFDAFVDRFGLGNDAALAQVAEIVRGADTSRLDLAPAAPGLFAISLGLSALFADDHRMLRHGLVVYDALYLWCRSLQGETHNWPPVIPARGAA